MPASSKPIRTAKLGPVPSAERDVVCVVDDDPAVLTSLKFALELEGFVVHTFPDAQSLLRKPEFGRQASLVVDYRLPDTNGLDLLQRLRANGAAGPAIIITSHPSVNLRRRAAALSIPIVEKPLLDDSLIAAIREQQKSLVGRRER